MSSAYSRVEPAPHVLALDSVPSKAPVAAPANISGPRVTLDSAALQWSSIPEEDARGFLRGYVIHYNELHHGRPGTERSEPCLN